MADINAVFRSMDITAMKTAQFADPQPKRIQQGNLRFMLDIVDGVNNGMDFLYGRHLGKKLVVVEIRNLITILVLVKDIEKKISQLCDMDVECPIIQFSDILKVTQIKTDFFIGYIGERFSGKFLLCPAKEFVQVRNVDRNSLRCKIPEREDAEMFLYKTTVKCIHGNSLP